MKKIVFVVAAAAILMLAAFLPFTAVNAYQNEPSWFTSAEYDDVYFISSAKEMYELIMLINDGCDFSGKTVCLTDSVTILLTSGAVKPFRGTFNGLGHTIFIRAGSKSPLFSELDGAEILNLSVTTTGKLILPQGAYGSPVAVFATNSLFDGVRVTGSLEFTRDTDSSAQTEMHSGMIAGYAEATDFFNCVSDVFSSSTHGAFAGAAALCGVENCFSGSAAPFAVMEDCEFKNVLCYDDPQIEGVLNYGSFTDAGTAIREMNTVAENTPDYNRWVVERAKPYVHLHSVEETSEIPATCVQKGQLTYICKCGSTVQSCSAPMIPHVYSDEGEVVDPTCTEEGYTLHNCDVCGQQIITDKVPKINHVTELVNALEPTCVKKGYTGDLVCIVCGAVVEKGASIRATGQHDWGNMEITKEPTVNEPGKIVLRCLNCKTKTVEEIPALGHVPLEYEFYNEDQHRADCTCGEEYYYENHKWDDGTAVKEPTAEEEGEMLYTCTVCKGTKTVAIAALGHNLKEWKPYDETCHAAECSCGELHKEEHQYDDGVDGGTRYENDFEYQSTVYTCAVCGAQKTVEEKIEKTQDDPGETTDPQESGIPRNTQITAAIIAGFALLLAGGITATVFIRKSDVK